MDWMGAKPECQFLLAEDLSLLRPYKVNIV